MNLSSLVTEKESLKSTNAVVNRLPRIRQVEAQSHEQRRAIAGGARRRHRIGPGVDRAAAGEAARRRPPPRGCVVVDGGGRRRRPIGQTFLRPAPLGAQPAPRRRRPADGRPGTRLPAQFQELESFRPFEKVQRPPPISLQAGRLVHRRRRYLNAYLNFSLSLSLPHCNFRLFELKCLSPTSECYTRRKIRYHRPFHELSEITTFHFGMRAS